MPLSDVRFVATAFLNQYIRYHDTPILSVYGIVLVPSRWHLECKFRAKPSDKIKICETINSSFYKKNGDFPESLNTVAGWVALLQDLTNKDPEQGELFKTTHAIRTYCIKEILKSEMGDEFRKVVADGRLDVVAKEKALRNAKLLESQIVPVKLENEYHTSLLMNANLGDENSGLDATEKAPQIANFPKPNSTTSDLPEDDKKELKANMPSVYNPNYYLMHYLRYERVINTGLSFEEFETDVTNYNVNAVYCPPYLKKNDAEGPKDTMSFWNKCVTFFFPGKHAKREEHYEPIPQLRPSPADHSDHE